MRAGTLASAADCVPGGEDEVDRVAARAGAVVPFRPRIALRVADDRLDGGAALSTSVCRAQSRNLAKSSTSMRPSADIKSALSQFSPAKGFTGYYLRSISMVW
jgi:hypothetical protein